MYGTLAFRILVDISSQKGKTGPVWPIGFQEV